MIRSLSLICLSMTVVAMMVVRASAQGYPTPAPQQQTYNQYQQQFHHNNWPNWYVGLSGQVSFVSDSRVKGTAPGTISFDTGHAWTGSLGYRPAFTDSLLDNMRFELEGQYRATDFDQFNGTPFDRDLTGYGTFLNAYYDIITGTQLTPYVGAGLGMMWWDFESPALATDDADGVFAYQLMTGVYYSPQSIPNTDWGVGYRYLSTSDPEFTNNLGSTFEHDYDSHNLELLARFRF